jgi:hypothetical protein
MPPAKPTPTVRSSTRAKKQPAPLEGRALQRELDRIGRKHERPAEGEHPVAGRGIVKMPGRATKEGRKGERVTRRATFYLPLEVHDELEVTAKRRGMSVSNAAAELLADALGVTLEATG